MPKVQISTILIMMIIIHIMIVGKDQKYIINQEIVQETINMIVHQIIHVHTIDHLGIMIIITIIINKSGTTKETCIEQTVKIIKPHLAAKRKVHSFLHQLLIHLTRHHPKKHHYLQLQKLMIQHRH